MAELGLLHRTSERLNDSSEWTARARRLHHSYDAGLHVSDMTFDLRREKDAHDGLQSPPRASCALSRRCNRYTDEPAKQIAYLHRSPPQMIIKMHRERYAR